MSKSKKIIGCSLATPDKQDGLQKIIQLHMSITDSVMKNYQGWVDPPYIYIDSYCGDGEKHVDADSSPMIFLNCLDAIINKTHSELKEFLVFFIDRDQSNIDNLNSILQSRFKNSIPSWLHTVCADSTKYVPKIAYNKKLVKPKTFGLLYIDPNSIPDISMLQSCSAYMPKIDFLIRVNCTALKRLKDIKNLRLFDVMKAANKKRWLVRRPLKSDVWQWTSILGVNYDNIKDWKKEGFYLDTSDEGKEILNKLHYTNQEIKNSGITIPSPKIKIESYNLFKELA